MELAHTLLLALAIGAGILFVITVAIVVAIFVKVIKCIDEDYVKGKLNKR